MSALPSMFAGCGGSSSIADIGGDAGTGEVVNLPDGGQIALPSGSSVTTLADGGQVAVLPDGGQITIPPGSTTSSGSSSTSTSTSSSTSAGTSSSSTTSASSSSSAAVCPDPGPTCCLSDTNCTDRNAPHCDTTTNRCVGCVSSSQCTGGTPICSPTTNLCQASCDGEGGITCGTAGGVATVCDTSTGACVGCVTSSDCTNSSASLCDTTTQRCVGCLSNSDCQGGTPVCDTTTGTCAQCATDSDCTSSTAPLCQGGRCVAGCTTSAQCTTTAARPVCDTMTDACVQCETNTDCPADGGAPYCETGTGRLAGALGTNRCVSCLPATAGSDAGVQGCTAGQTCVVGVNGNTCR